MKTGVAVAIGLSVLIVGGGAAYFLMRPKLTPAQMAAMAAAKSQAAANKVQAQQAGMNPQATANAQTTALIGAGIGAAGDILGGFFDNGVSSDDGSSGFADMSLE